MRETSMLSSPGGRQLARLIIGAGAVRLANLPTFVPADTGGETN